MFRHYFRAFKLRVVSYHRSCQKRMESVENSKRAEAAAREEQQREFHAQRLAIEARLEDVQRREREANALQLATQQQQHSITNNVVRSQLPSQQQEQNAQEMAKELAYQAKLFESERR